MKKVLFFSAFASISTVMYTAGLLVLSCVSACQHTEPTPTVTYSGYDNSEYTEINSEAAGDFTLTAALCSEMPRDLDAQVWYYDASMSEADAIATATTQTFDEDGEPEGTPDPDEMFDIRATYLQDGQRVSNYHADKTLTLFLNPDRMAVISLSDGTRTTYQAVKTTVSGQLTKCFELK